MALLHATLSSHNGGTMSQPRFDAATIQQKIASHPNWYHQIELAPGIVTPGHHLSAIQVQRLEALGLPRDFSGLRVLDIGCADGFFSFEAEKRGATQVVAVDYRKPTSSGFSLASEILGSQVEYHIDNVYDLTPEEYGTFDVIFFLGVLYHLRNPLLAFDRIRQIIKPGGLLFVESQIIDNYLLLEDGSVSSLEALSPRLAALPLWQFFGRNKLRQDSTNKWSPNMTALRELVQEAQFDIIADAQFRERGLVMAQAISDREREHFRQLDESKGAR